MKDFLLSILYSLMIVCIGLMEVGVSIALAILYDSIIVLMISVAFWLWFNNVIMKRVVKILDKGIVVD